MKRLTDAQASEVIEMALCDDTSFAAIEATYGLNESGVKKLTLSTAATALGGNGFALSATAEPSIR